MTTTAKHETKRANRMELRERFIEEGTAFMELSGLALSNGKKSNPRTASSERERFDVIVIGAGQAGLSVGYYLAQRGLRFVILDANQRIGDSWRKRWDSLRLFTSARYDGLDGMPFPAPPHSFPTKDEMGDYLEAYARHFALPVRNGVKVSRLSREGARYVVAAGDVELEAEQVVVAMANYQAPRAPEFARELRSEIVQLHSSEYKNPSQLREGGVLIVGAGNSGAEIAFELARSHRTFLSGRHPGNLPFRISGLLGRLLLVKIVLRVIFHRVMTVKTAVGRKMRVKMLTQGGPLIRQKPKDLSAAGVERLPMITGTKDGMPALEDGRLLDVANVIWCTGFDSGLSWIDLPIFGEYGEPVHEAGAVKDAPGLYFVGRMFLYAASSVMVHGVGRDAARVAEMIAKRGGRCQPRRRDQRFSHVQILSTPVIGCMALLMAAIALLGCSSNDSSSSPVGPASAVTLAAPPDGKGIQLKLAWTLGAGEEKTNCLVKTLPTSANGGPLYAIGFEHQYTENASHHTLLYPTSLRAHRFANASIS